MNEHRHRILFWADTTDAQKAIGAELDMFEEYLHGYTIKEVVEFPGTTTLYVEAYPRHESFYPFLNFVMGSAILRKAFEAA